MSIEIKGTSSGAAAVQVTGYCDEEIVPAKGKKPKAGEGVPGGIGPSCEGDLPVDVEGVAELYAQQLAEDARTARVLAAGQRLRIRAEGEKIVSTLKKQADKAQSSAIWNGVITIASAVVSAACSGAGAGASSAAGGASQTGGAAGQAAGGVASWVASQAANAFLKNLVVQQAPKLLDAVKCFDPYALQAEKLAVVKQGHENEKQMQEIQHKITGDQLDSIRQARARVIEFMNRALQLEEEGKRAAINALRG